MDRIPTDVIKIIIGFYPSAKWFLLSKATYAVALKVISPLSYETEPLLWALGNERPKNALAAAFFLGLKDPRIDPSIQDNLAIRVACGHGYTELAKVLLQYICVDPSVRGNYAIRIASENGHKEIVEMLLQDKRVDPSATSNYAIRFASTRGHKEIVERLLKDSRVDPSACGNYALQQAQCRGHKEIEKLLCQHPCVRKWLPTDHSVLHHHPTDCFEKLLLHASHNGWKEVVDALLHHLNVDPSISDSAAIGCASMMGHKEIVQLLLTDPRVDPSAACNRAVLWAGVCGHKEIVDLLLQDPRVNRRREILELPSNYYCVYIWSIMKY
jgi:ankyrin repeat protein